MLCPSFKGATVKSISQGFSSQHPAIDLAGKLGEDLLAPENCKITSIVDAGTKIDGSNAGYSRGYGLRMTSIANHNTYHNFWHTLGVFPVNLNETVLQGQPVAEMGNSGSVYSNGVYVPIEIRTKSPYFGTHLHWEYIKDGVPADPLPYIDWNFPINYSVITMITKIFQKLFRILN